MMLFPLLSALLLTFVPLLEFSSPSSTSSITRIDDVIMGGVSSSRFSPRPSPKGTNKTNPVASFNGKIRKSGGGFCGFRTNPFLSPLPLRGEWSGVYIDAELVSDDDVGGRNWKVSIRNDDSRGERVYQAVLPLSPTGGAPGRTKYPLPFDEFSLVRGARLEPEQVPFDAGGNLTQVGLTVSMFEFGRDRLTVMDGFREGFFDLEVREIGLYKGDGDGEGDGEGEGGTTEEEEEAGLGRIVTTDSDQRRRRPLALRAVLKVLGVLFSERSRRSKEAFALLRSRGGSRVGIWRFGTRVRGDRFPVFKVGSVVARDCGMYLLTKSIKIAVVKPIVAVAKLKKGLKMKKKEEEN